MSNNLATMPAPETGNLPQRVSTGVAASQARAIQEVQAALVIAQQCPRNVLEAIERIKNACARPGLAVQALYSYAKGGAPVSGPSIRLAEAVAQLWGNIDFGWRETERGKDPDGTGYSEVQAYAWDLETNTRKSLNFRVRHWRDKRGGGVPIEGERDVYEHVANMAQRRVRACVLSVVPGDVIEEAVKQSETTLAAEADLSSEGIKRLIETFKSIGIDRSQIESRIQRKIDAITAAQVVQLRKVYQSIKDGISEAGDHFDGYHAAKAKAGAGEVIDPTSAPEPSPATPAEEKQAKDETRAKEAAEEQASEEDDTTASEDELAF